ncbi:N-(5'-phosphoribosyl)anthranilate isomerase [Hyella patelloides LEGE 07179]|uniref:N-(5'-phosphoribosyl)anthranilate isomerase n=1 Tax=Hyella patelloides LEGE 07179 TaxID=945734 RepID=A0A563VLV6_9CYAN|nr:N-(5'-phosphoribosyl)anthranilate isomerase [Hyella patelloides LEGE 07179]
MRIKICGITKSAQGNEIIKLGATALGFICVERSPRYITPLQIKAIIDDLPSLVDTIGVFANAKASEIIETVKITGITGVQLHGAESPQFCQQLKKQLPQEIELIKAFRVKTPESLTETTTYTEYVDTLLLDAYHPQMLGGTGQTLNWLDLQQFQPSLPWMLAGGLNPQNVTEALSQLKPDGIDLSSGIERSPGDKDLSKVTQLFQTLTN